MRLQPNQLEHLAALRVANAVREYDRETRREWQWKPRLSGPMIRPRIMDVLVRRKLARWMPAVSNDLPATGGRYIITSAGKNFLRDADGF